MSGHSLSNSSAVTTNDDGSSTRKPVMSKRSFQFSAGFLSGLSTAILLQPADLLKTRVQQAPSSTSLATTIRAILYPPTSNPSTSTASAAPPHNVTSDHSGQPPRAKAQFLSLYRGTLPSALRTSLGSALYFSGVTNLRLFLTKHTSPTSSTATFPIQLSTNTTNLLSGAIARALAGLAIMPITVLKVRFESSLHSYPSLRAAAADVFRERGVKGFFAGFGATAVRDAPYAGLYVLFYEGFKSKARAMFDVAAPSTDSNISLQITKQVKEKGGALAAINFGSGILAACLATAITNPFDAVKTRLQLQPDLYRNTFVAFGKMLREEGWQSLFRGLGLRMARKGVSSALAWTVYEEVVRRWEVRLVGTSTGV